jgi:hypothetical protein
VPRTRGDAFLTTTVYDSPVSEKMRIGELLLLKERIDPWLLTNTLKEQSATRQRLISLLIARAHLDPDEGAMLLSDQLGYPAAMQRHLERRESRVLGLIPPQLGSAWVVLPIGYAKTGSLIIVARDPTPILTAALEHIVRGSVTLAVTPSAQLERLVRAVYGGSTPPEEPLPHTPPTLSDIGNVQLDDETPLPIRRARTVSYMFDGSPQLPDRAPQPIDPLEKVLAKVDKSNHAIGAELVVMAYVARRWSSSLLAKVKPGLVLGMRGHNVDHPETLRIPLTEESIVSIAAGSRHATQATPETPTQARLEAVMGNPSNLAAAPIIVGKRVDSVLVVGEPVENAATGLAELDRLVDALGATYDRFSRA